MATSDDHNAVDALFGDISLQTDNLEAINKYIMETKIKTKLAETLRTDWMVWWESLGWYDKSIDGDTYDKARNRKHAFDLANTTSAKEKAVVAEQIKTAFTTEETRGQTKRTTSDGNYLEDPVKKEPFVPTRIKVAGGIILAIAGGLWLLKKTYIDPLLRIAH